MKLICGLGNPGSKYTDTWHNVGFAVCEIIADKIGADFRSKKFASLYGEARWSGEKVMLLKPQTYMNRSGDALSPAVGFFQLEPEQVLVVHDDADLPVGRMRFKRGGGTAGHKGLISLRERLGTDQFHRLRFGVGRPEDARIELADYVLGRIPDEVRERHKQLLAVAAEAALAWVAEGIEAAMNEYNGFA